MRDVRTPSLDGRLVRVRYKDHVIFDDMSVRETPFDRRETVDWYLDKDDKSIIIVHDRSRIVRDIRDEEHASGLVLLRSDLERVTPLD